MEPLQSKWDVVRFYIPLIIFKLINVTIVEQIMKVWTGYDISNNILSLLMLRRYSFILYNDTFKEIYKNKEGNITTYNTIENKQVGKIQG